MNILTTGYCRKSSPPSYAALFQDPLRFSSSTKRQRFLRQVQIRRVFSLLDGPSSSDDRVFGKEGSIEGLLYGIPSPGTVDAFMMSLSSALD